jgi:hypothetical protein
MKKTKYQKKLVFPTVPLEVIVDTVLKYRSKRKKKKPQRRKKVKGVTSI